MTAGSLAVTRSIGPLLGPGAKAGQAGWILEADLATLEDAMGALGDEAFRDLKARAEALTSMIFLYEVAEV